jgi:hypothetical protein
MGVKKMICTRCHRDFPSEYYFADQSICNECIEKLPETEKQAIIKEAESHTHEGASRRTISGREMICPICGHDHFWKRRTLMNTPGMTFMGVEWANKQAENLICNSCGYIYWFMKA